MRKPGTDPANVQMSDVLCDFCRREWTEDVPMIEGHQGSVMCGRCLSVAYRQLVLDREAAAPEGYRCTLCLEHRDDPGWQSPACPEALACLRCVKQAAGVLHKDPDWAWRKPA